MGPHTSVCMIPNKSSARSIIPLNGVLVILPMRHGSHVSRDPKSNESRSPSLWSFSMRFYTNMTKSAMPHLHVIFIILQSLGLYIVNVTHVTIEIKYE